MFSDHVKLNQKSLTKISGKSSTIWNSIPVNNPQVKNKIKREIEKYFELTRSINTTYQNLWNAAKALLKGKFIALNASIRKEERSQINDLSLQLRKQGE